MYNELVKRMRNKGCQICPICREAADAIEELSKRVPPVPHGRLIDADALLDDLLFPSKQFEQGMRELIGDAPTIVPAEETIKEATNDQNNS